MALQYNLYIESSSNEDYTIYDDPSTIFGFAMISRKTTINMKTKE